MTPSPSFACSLSNRDLLAEVERAAKCERQATAHLIALLMEVDSRKLYAGQGYSSLFTYCVQRLHVSEHAAYLRIEAPHHSLPPARHHGLLRQADKQESSIVQLSCSINQSMTR